MGFIANGLHLPVFMGTIKQLNMMVLPRLRLHLPVFVGAIKHYKKTSAQKGLLP